MAMRVHKFDVAVSCACLVLLGYFGWHAFSGPRGHEHQRRLAEKATALTEKLDASMTERKLLEARVALLRPESLDPDMLDEMARNTLAVARPDELIVIQNR